MHTHSVQLLGSLVLAAAIGCRPPPPKTYPQGAFMEAVPITEPPPPKPEVATPAATTNVTAQLRPAPRPATTSSGGSSKSPASPLQALEAANRTAIKVADSADYFNAIAQYPYEPGTLYQVYAAPLFITAIVLEPGEKLVTDPASGDPIRWILGVGKSHDKGVEQTHIYVKPTRAGLRTNLALNTNRRTYLLELQSFEESYMAAVKWNYPQDEIARLTQQNAETYALERNAAPIVSLDSLSFDYAVHVMNGAPVWTPVQVFDDGRKTFIRFPATMQVREAPALFVLRDKQTQLVNYRKKGNFYVVDRLFEEAELRVGQKDQEIVRITRSRGGSRASGRAKATHTGGYGGHR